MTQFMDHLLVSMYKAVLENENKTVQKNIPLCLKLIGRYCAPRSYETMVLQAIRNELESYLPHTQSGSLRCFGYIFSGAVEIIPKDEDLKYVEQTLEGFVRAVNEHILDALDSELADHLTESLSQIIEVLLTKQEQGLDISLWHKHEKDFFYMLIRCLGVYQNLKMINKPETEHIIAQKKKCLAMLNKLTLISKNPEIDFFEQNLRPYFNEQFPDDESIEKSKDWAVQNYKWRIFYVVFELLEEKHLPYHLDHDAKITILERVSHILSAILKNGEGQNFNVKQFTLTNLIPMFINKSIKLISPHITHLYLTILKFASLTEWKTPDDKTKNLTQVLKLHNNLIDLNGVLIDKDNVKQFDDFMESLSVFYKEKKEPIKVEFLKLLRRYLELAYTQLVSGLDINEKLKLFQHFTFLSNLTEELLKYLTDYYDSVREQSQLLLTYIVQYFLADELTFDQEQDHLLQILRSNALMGWSALMSQKLKDAADMECQMAKHAFKDTQSYVKNIVAIMMDETTGRDNLINIIKEFNRKLPFVVLNDFRIAQASNSLRRVEILKELIFKPQDKFM